MDSKGAKKMLKMVAIAYIAAFLLINWNDVSWIFNYKEVSGLASDFFNPYPSIDTLAMGGYFYPNHSVPATAGQNMILSAKTTETDKQNILEIPAIGISVPVVFAQSTDKSQLEKNLDQGAVYYPGSVYPGQKGQILILGHSAPAGWPKIKHDWIFTNIGKLAAGDKIFIDLNGKQYQYSVVSRTIVKRGAEVPTGESAKTNVLTLVSCWPPGKDYQRITVQAELVVDK